MCFTYLPQYTTLLSNPQLDSRKWEAGSASLDGLECTDAWRKRNEKKLKHKDRSQWEMGGAKSQTEDQKITERNWLRVRIREEKWREMQTTLDAKLTVLLKLNSFSHI